MRVHIKAASVAKADQLADHLDTHPNCQGLHYARREGTLFAVVGDDIAEFINLLFMATANGLVTTDTGFLAAMDLLANIHVARSA